MFDKDFYPTPKSVVFKLISGIDFNEYSYVLDPQGGKGDILDVIQERISSRHYVKQTHLFTCEINPDLRAILSEKGFAVLKDDFLEYSGEILFTHVIMNPPFSNWERHFLKAWDVLKEGEFRSIIPSRFFLKDRADMTEFQKNIKDILDDNHAEIEHLNGAFRTSERWTDEEVSIVKMKKVGDERFKIDFEPFNSTRSDAPEFTKMNELSIGGFVPLLIGTYNAAVNSYRTYLQERQKMEYYIQGFASYWNGEKTVNILKKVDGMVDNTPQERYNTFLSLIWDAAWTKLFEFPTLQGILTDRAQTMMTKFRQNQRRLDFNVENILSMIDAIEIMRDDLLNAAIEDAFDNMTKYHEYNRVHVEGWKTDKCWKVGKKVIFPWGIASGIYRSSYNTASVECNKRNQFDDIDRAMCLLKGLPFNSIQTISSTIEGSRIGDKIESEFFYIRCYLKGTVHLVFKDLELLKDFNVAAARAKKWLGDGG